MLQGAEQARAAAGELTPGVVHFGTPLDPAWALRVAGQEVAGRPGFGVATAYDVAASGASELDYRSPSGRTVWLVVQAALWVAALVAASRLSVPDRLRMTRARDETLIDLDAEPGAGLPPPPPPLPSGFGGWIDELVAAEAAEVDRPPTPSTVDSAPADTAVETPGGPPP